MLALIAMAVWLTFPPAQTPAPGFESDVGTSENRSTSGDPATSSTTKPGSDSPPNLSSIGLSREQYQADVLRQFEGTASAALQRSIAREVSDEFTTFFTELDVSAAREQLLLDALIQAYTEIRLLAAAMAHGEIAEEDIDRLRNPDHVLDSLSPHLDQDELALLEETLETNARADFELASVSQLEAAIPQLEAEDRELILDTLFYETYALTSPDGLAMGGVVDHLESQLKALDNAATILSGSMNQQKMEDVSAFLDEKRRALAATAIIFDQ